MKSSSPDPLPPLGQPVPKANKPEQPERRPVPGSPHLEVNRQGQYRTNIPPPPLKP